MANKKESSKADPSAKTVPPPNDSGYPPVEHRKPMEQDEEGNDVGEGSETYKGVTGHKAR